MSFDLDTESFRGHKLVVPRSVFPAGSDVSLVYGAFLVALANDELHILGLQDCEEGKLEGKRIIIPLSFLQENPEMRRDLRVEFISWHSQEIGFRWENCIGFTYYIREERKGPEACIGRNGMLTSVLYKASLVTFKGMRPEWDWTKDMRHAAKRISKYLKDLFGFKCVSKELNHLIGDHYFVRKHLDHSPSGTFPVAEQPPFAALQSSDGLILEKHNASKEFRIRNPAMGQVFYIPNPHKRNRVLRYGFAPISGFYKLICLYDCNVAGNGNGGVEILLLGTEDKPSWKRVDSTHLQSLAKNDLLGACPVEGVVHIAKISLIRSRDHEVVSFDLDTESFRVKLESRDHMFLHCRVVWLFWMKLSRWWGVSWCMPSTLEELFVQWLELAGVGKARSSWMTVFFAAAWGLWLARNRIIFENREVEWDRLHLRAWLCRHPPKLKRKLQHICSNKPTSKGAKWCELWVKKYLNEEKLKVKERNTPLAAIYRQFSQWNSSLRY
ncbi:hypothetical protein Tsubulata_044165 [Turnera subulata]|uniref:F-box associated beta-propeller type 3 domain-containing protein n=1 Tax=Turnera subulata TaxID=218843 RepID=A0A9Q0JEI3_9ROSI|nr:hypothetical protein Tsubulata_044165 [Turnera subulata]